MRYFKKLPTQEVVDLTVTTKSLCTRTQGYFLTALKQGKIHEIKANIRGKPTRLFVKGIEEANGKVVYNHTPVGGEVVGYAAGYNSETHQYCRLGVEDGKIFVYSAYNLDASTGKPGFEASHKVKTAFKNHGETHE